MLIWKKNVEDACISRNWNNATLEYFWLAYQLEIGADPQL